MNSISEQEFKRRYQMGQAAFEQGRYRLSIQNFEEAQKFTSPYGRVGGEVKMWLVNAYQAVGEEDKAIELCEKLVANSYGETKRQAQKLLYIIKAPKLERPKEWMTEIPNLDKVNESTLKYQPIVQKKKKIEPKRQIELVDLSKVNNKDNNFIVVTLLISCLVVLSLFIF